ncbi:MAG: bifunctional (p)ppGpp synthetase/guanosine-3',5'-bis(diphosphate) 3'-pyrophosphohydrolase [Bacteroidetes bacterium]|nr:bifunctional (p)ppGpp synthetase/guanosine-3',5'-bis(diphosphate) 3'-pyrophosphohydrolase [Rhodothermia bacterium]MCX7906702.1 bifunctional (p)ppGpp synthetase/guanosine-3',5'-bis(diphosphate) 3'-pyrophosphohydrolase [Bacteroidota bacterium]MDW8285111.1 bifunctional (p)ppGpp synthetase/guanosine-3',5'-bis(diphosphate) 3'-pyrophosphohydrolase [Bacteroidota bacterium]
MPDAKPPAPSVSSTLPAASEIVLPPLYRDILEELLGLCRQHLRTVDEALIQKAFAVAYIAHEGHVRASGEPYVLHPIEVAKIVAQEIALDDISVAAALLHDVVEDTEYSLEVIRAEFGETIARIIDGLTKISGLFRSRAITQAESFRKLLLSMVQDVRVIFIKFADRLHNMRTIEVLPPERRLRIAYETRDLYAPLAHRFGLFRIKSELEDLALKVIEPEAYRFIARKLREKRQEREAYIERFVRPIRERLEQAGLRFEITGRPKHIYSIYRKMRIQGKPFEEIYDLFAVRIILDVPESEGKEACWRVYGIVTDIYTPIPDRFRDFLSVPKANGYQSLHTTVIGPDGRPVEVQIRTRQMHEVAERGLAAHWKYKEGLQSVNAELDRWIGWVRDILESRTEAPTEFVQDLKLSLYQDEIYVFTPKGDLITLPAGATPVDFAFHIHTEIGLHCIGAKVNGRIVPLSHKLQSGDQVEILTSRRQQPNPDWLNFVVTHKARAKIRQFINEQRRQTIEAGRALLEKHLEKRKRSVPDQDLNRVAAALKFPNVAQMFYELGAELLSPEEVLQTLARLEQHPEAPPPTPASESSYLQEARQERGDAILIEGEPLGRLSYDYARCCNPIPGDEVIGYVSRNGTLRIHRTSCQNVAHLVQTEPERIKRVDWARHKDLEFIAGLRIMGEDRVGMLNDITNVISRGLKTNIRSINIDTQDGMFDGTIILYVHDLDHLNRLIERLRRIPGVYSVTRFEG